MTTPTQPRTIEHNIDISPEDFADLVTGTMLVKEGDKPLEYGQFVKFHVYDETVGKWSGEFAVRRLTRVIRGHAGLAPGYVLVDYERER